MCGRPDCGRCPRFPGSQRVWLRRGQRRRRAGRTASRRSTPAASAGRAASPFDRAAVHPALNGVDLIVAQPPLAENRKFAGFGQPRRHVPLARFVRDRAGMFHRVGVGQKRKRRRLVRPMARRAVGEEDRRDVLGERRRRRGAAPRPSVRECTDGGVRRDPREAANE